MERNFYCPICGALQKKVLLEESDNHFVCDGCGEVTGANWIRLAGERKLCLDCWKGYDRFCV